MIYILNFNNSKDLHEIKYMFEKYKGTNIDDLLQSFKTGRTVWSVPQKAQLGDIVVFMCAKTARNNLGLATSHIPSNYSEAFRLFVEQQKALYKKYSGNLLGIGTVTSAPEHDQVSNRWFSDIGQLRQFKNPIHIDDFRSFISISKTNSVTKLNESQWKRLQWLTNQKNPGFFPEAAAPDAEMLKEEFETAVQKAETKTLSQLKREAEKKSSKPTATEVQSKTYYRDPIIAAYVKKRANGHCQLCGMKAPFVDQNGKPFLECHHIDWLSNDGMDSADNCVALCPNCHRKMHVLNDSKDIQKLKAIILSSK